MTVSGPVSGISKVNLFDTIVDTIAGAGTGWSLAYDTRVSGIGFQPITRKSSLPLTSDLSTKYPPADGYDQKMSLANEDTSGSLFIQANGASSDGAVPTNDQMYLYTSSDGVTFSSGTQPSTAFTAADNREPTAVSHRPMGDDNKYISVALKWNGIAFVVNVSENATGPYISASVNDIIANQTVSVTGNPSGSPSSRTADRTLYSCYSYCPDKYTMYTFHHYLVGGSLDCVLAFKWTIVGNAGNITQSGNPIHLFSSTSLAADKLFGVVGIEPSGANLDLLVNVGMGGVTKVIRLRSDGAEPHLANWSVVDTTPQELTYGLPNSEPINSFRIVLDGSATSTGQPKRILANTVATGSSSDTTGIFSDTGENSSTYTKGFEGGVSGNPDYFGREYEYAIFESDYTLNGGNGYFLVILQQSPQQVAPPAVTGEDDVLPIYFRLIRNFDGLNTNSIDRFIFDPVYPVGVDADAERVTAPALFSIPNIGAIPEETHKLWFKMNSRQIFIFSESTNGTSQYVHLNILDPLLPIETTPTDVANDNVILSSGGITNQVGCIYLGKNGFDEADLADLRLDGESYYGRGFELSYSSMLTGVNQVDNKSYTFDIFVGNNASNFASPPVSDLSFLVGKMIGTKLMTSASSSNTGSDVVVEATNYKLFKINSTADLHDDSVVKNILIEWV